MKKWLTMLSGLLAWSEPTLKENKVDLSEEESTQLNSMLGEDKAKMLIDLANKDLEGIQDANAQLEALQTQSQNQASALIAAQEALASVTTTAQEQAQTIAKLKEEPITEGIPVNHASQFLGGAKAVLTGVATILAAQGVFGSVDRPWNARALGGSAVMATDFTKEVNVDLLQGDLEHFIRQNPTAISEIYNQYFNIPEQWKRNTITQVLDRVTTASITVSSVTQPRKNFWAPKGGVSIKAEEMRIRKVQMDLEFTHEELSIIENNWLNSFNKEGNQAYKYTFMYFLLEHYLKKARAEDAEALVQGVYVETPSNYGAAVSHLFRNNGVLKLLYDAREIDEKYRPFNLGVPTFQNIVEYVDSMIKMLPEKVKMQKLEYSLPTEHLRWYKRRYEQLYGGNNDYSGYPTNPKDYPNIEFVAVDLFSGVDLHNITFPDNIAPLEGNPAEKSMVTVEKSKRTLVAFLDYGMGIGIKHIGLKVDKNDPNKYVHQAVWTNNVALFTSNFYVNAYDDATGILKAAHYQVQVAPNFTTDITNIETSEKFLTILGDISLPGVTKVKHDNAKIKLVGNADFNLKTGGKLVLVKQGNIWVEVSRTAAPDTVKSAKEFTGDAIEYVDAVEFVYKGAASETLTAISDGQLGNKLRVYGQSTNTLTIDNVTGNISVTATALLNAENKYVDFIYVNGVWTEVGRSV